MTTCIFLTFASVCILSAAVMCILCGKEKLLPVIEKLPRAKIAGILLMCVSLFWCVYHLRPILAPDSFFHPLLIPGAVTGTILCAIFLDFLFARGLAAFTILLVSYLLSESFRLNLPAFSIPLAVGLFLLGIGAILIGAKPWWMRTWIRGIVRNKAVCLASVLFFLYLTGTTITITLKGGLL